MFLIFVYLYTLRRQNEICNVLLKHKQLLIIDFGVSLTFNLIFREHFTEIQYDPLSFKKLKSVSKWRFQDCRQKLKTRVPYKRTQRFTVLSPFLQIW